MYERFTDRARKVMRLANEEAQHLNHECIGTEHILLGLVKEGGGVASEILKRHGINFQIVREEVDMRVNSGPDMVVMGRLPLTPRVTRVLDFSREESRKLNHNYIGTEHLLLGLLRDEGGIAFEVLSGLGLKLEEVRAEIFQLLGAAVDRQTELGNSDLIAVAVTQLEIHLGQLFCNLLREAGYSESQMQQLPAALKLPDEKHVVTCGDVVILQEYVTKRNRLAAIIHVLEEVRKALPPR